MPLTLGRLISCFMAVAVWVLREADTKLGLGGKRLIEGNGWEA